MYYYYSRISTLTQNSSRQIANFKMHGEFIAENLFVDKVQGNVPFLERPEASKLFDIVTSLEKSDVTIVVDSIDRLGRNLIDVLNTIERFTDNGINLKSIKEGFETLVNGEKNPIAMVVVSVMGSIAEMERNRIKERTSEGIKIAQAKGKFKGRKVGSVQSSTRLLERHPNIVKKLNKGLTVREVAEIVGKSTTTVMKVRKTMKLSK
ncbi:recombinase family protein [Psychroflexus sp. CAK1W]|uniref:recombinase family protein n=1 Tax=Psychroflexus curvus TaxID=2873595 RepID=UPI001CCCD800|nr:recombinase family protein [Psychroflexus curvus]MBZ9628138.1 recombinase family protein [Psychroflexus curvus]